MKLFNKKQSTIAVASPIRGKTVVLGKVPDDTFSQEILGKGIAIEPSEGMVYAPFDGVVDLMFETGHAVNLIGDHGVELLIHVGIDTVKLKGKWYTPCVISGQTVTKGQLLMRFDLSQIQWEGYRVITPIVICNSHVYQEIEPVADIVVSPGDTILKLEQ